MKEIGSTLPAHLNPMNIIRHRHFGPIFALCAVTIYIIRRLKEETFEYNKILKLAGENSALGFKIFLRLEDENYDFELNNTFPLVAEACFFLIAWYVFHHYVFPKLSRTLDDKNSWLAAGAVMLLLTAGAFTYNYFRLHLYGDYKTGEHQYYRTRISEHLIGRLTNSKDLLYCYIRYYYRKKTVFADAVGLGLLVIICELVAQYFQFLIHRINTKASWLAKFVSYLQLIILILLTTALPFLIDLGDPQPFWYYFGPFFSKMGLYSLRNFMLPAWYTVLIVLLIIYFSGIFWQRSTDSNAWLKLRSLSLCIILAFMASYLMQKTFSFGGYSDDQDTIAALLIKYPLRASLIFTSFCVTISFVFVFIPIVRYIPSLVLQATRSMQTRLFNQEAELASLRAQIHPHFLHNILSNLYSTALREESEETAEGILQLSGLMRFMLKESNLDSVPLDKEIDYLHNYIELQRGRLDKSRDIHVKIYFQDPDRKIHLAPMLLQPFIENAFKHGISFLKPSWIYVTLTSDANHLYFKVNNSNHNRTFKDEIEGSGVGLENIRKRLNILYPKRHQLMIQESQKEFSVSLTLTL